MTTKTQTNYRRPKHNRRQRWMVSQLRHALYGRKSNVDYHGDSFWVDGFDDKKETKG